MLQNDLLNHLSIRPLRQNVPKNVTKDVLLNHLKIKALGYSPTKTTYLPETKDTNVHDCVQTHAIAYNRM